MHTSGPCAAPALPHRYTLRLCLALRYLAHLHMPFLSTSHSCGCIRGGSWGERYKDSVWRTYNLQTEAVSQPWSPMSRCSSLVCWRERTESPILQPRSLPPSRRNDTEEKEGAGDGGKEMWRNTKGMEKQSRRRGEWRRQRSGRGVRGERRDWRKHDKEGKK